MKEYIYNAIEINIKNHRNLVLKWIAIPLIYIVSYYISWKVKIDCIWLTVFGVCCPGCGFTRSILSALSLNFVQAWYYHPMFWSLPVLGAYYIMNGNVFKNKVLNRLIFGIVAAGFLFVWGYRLIFEIVIR